MCTTTNSQKWVPYDSDPDKWYQHFLDLRHGYVEPDHLGRYVVGSGTKYRKLKEMEEKDKIPEVNLVSLIAQAIEMAKSEMKKERKKDDSKIQEDRYSSITTKP